jgi:hypothetical protein
MKDGSARSGPKVQRAFSLAKNGEEYLLLSVLISFPEKSEYIRSRLELNDIKDKLVFSLLKKIFSLGNTWDVVHILDIADEEERKIVTRYSVEPGFEPEYIDKSIEDCLKRIENSKLDKSLQTTGDKELGNLLLIEKRSLEGKGL